jgi:hypothetical protein
VIDNILEFNVIVSNVFIVAWEPITDKLFEVNEDVSLEVDTAITVEGIYVLTDVTFISLSDSEDNPGMSVFK